MLDTKGPEIRTGMLPEGVKKIAYKKGQDLEISNKYNKFEILDTIFSQFLY